MSFIPLWPNLQPRATDPLWFNADKPVDDESEVTALEEERKTWVKLFYSSFISCKFLLIVKLNNYNENLSSFSNN